MKNEKGTIVLAGGVIGLIAAILVFFGNPANMGFCIACFLRDTTGALGLHSAAAVQYIRPEIIGLVLGACIISLAKKGNDTCSKHQTNDLRTDILNCCR